VICKKCKNEMARIYYGCPSPAINDLVAAGKLVVGNESSEKYSWAPKFYCKNCGIGYPTFSRV
jgi:hypothetical protein